MQVKKMKAAILVEQKKPLVIDEVELPGELKYGQVLVKIHYTGICGSQIGEINGVKGPDAYLPHLLGHEAAATVLETGPGVKTVQVDDDVVLHWMRGAGIESETPVYQWKGKPLNAGWIATFNEYAIISENRMTKVGKSLKTPLAALFGCAVTTGMGVVSNNAKVKFGESVLVLGAGGVGLNVIQGASLSSAYPIIGVDVFDNRLALAEKVGATHTINSKSNDLATEIEKIMGKELFDVVIDNTGSPQLIEFAYSKTKPKGRTVLVGVPRKGNNINIYSLPLHFGKTITGSHGGETNPTEDIPRYTKMLEAGLLKLDEFISQEFALEDINKAIDMMISGELAGRCLVKL